MTKPDLVVLFSGGLDSTVLMRLADQLGFHPLAVLVDYDQRHIRELETAEAYCVSNKIPYRRVTWNIPGLRSALTSEESDLYEGVSEWHVPSRNLIFLGLAAAVAESEGINKVWYGPNLDDRMNLFPDCYQDWVYYVNQVLARNGSYPIELEAPLLGWRKDSIRRLAKSLGIKEEATHSGYER